MQVPINDHRAFFSVAQFDWPKETLENRTGDELLKAAGTLRGYMNMHEFLVDKFLRPLAEVLEALAKKQHRKTANRKTTKKEKQNATRKDRRKRTANSGARVSRVTKSRAR